MKTVLKLMLCELNLIYGLMKLLPVKDKVVYLSRQSNSKSEDMILLEKELSRIRPELQQVFLCKKFEGGVISKLGYVFHILEQMYHIATSKVVILDSYCISVSVLKHRETLVVIQMWHALGSLKKFGKSIVGNGEGRDGDIADIFAMHKNYDYILTSSEVCAANFAEAFGYPMDNMVVMSLPRVDKLTDEELRNFTVEKIYRDYPEFKRKKVVVYAPTLRIGRDISVEIARLSEAFELVFDTNEYVLVVKKHPLMEIDFSIGANVSVDSKRKISLINDQKFTTLEMLFAADYVICDYSAVIYEAAIIGKPMFFYAFDYDTYGVERDFYIDYMNEMPGVISSDPKRIAEAVRHEEYDISRVVGFARRYVEQQEGCAARLAEFVIDNL